MPGLGEAVFCEFMFLLLHLFQIAYLCQNLASQLDRIVDTLQELQVNFELT